MNEIKDDVLRNVKYILLIYRCDGKGKFIEYDYMFFYKNGIF